MNGPVTQAQNLVQGPQEARRITKGDLCQELFQSLGQTSKPEKIKVLTDQISKMDCYEGVAAATDRMAAFANPADAVAVENAIDYAVGNDAEPSRE